MSKTRPVGATALPSAWQLFRGSLDAFWMHPWRYLIIVGIVTVPSNLIGLSASLASDTTVSFYLNLASLFMTGALLWAVVHAQAETTLKLRQAYYEGSAILLRFVVVAAVLAMMVLPAAIGLSLYNLGSASTGGSVSLGIQLLLGFLALLLSLPTFYWLVRFGLSIFRVAAAGEWPMAALKASRKLTLGYFWPLAGRLVLLLVWIALLMIVPLIVLIGLAILTHAIFFIVLLQIAFSLIAVPFISLYTYRLYQALQGA